MDIDRFRGLIAVQEAVSAAPADLDAIMQAIVSAPAVMPQANGIVIELRDRDQLYYAAASGTSASLVGLRLPLNASLSGMSILTGHPLRCADSETDSRVNRAACRRVGLRSMIVVPIPHLGRTVGVLKYHAAEPDAFSDEDMMIAHLMAGPLTIGFANMGEEDANRHRTELQDIVRMKEQFVSTVSHELRTPVTSIIAALGLIHAPAQEAASPQIRNLVDIAARNAQRLRRLVDDLLDMDRLDAGRMVLNVADVDLCQLLRDVVEQNRPFATRAGSTLILHLPAKPVVAHVDAERLEQAVVNLLSNAAKFSPSESEVNIFLAQRGDRAVIRVVDEGPGIPEHLRHRLFDRFAQLEHTQGISEQPGTGLGLAISRGMVEQMNGSIALDEDHAPGAAFEITVPLAQAKSRESAA